MSVRAAFVAAACSLVLVFASAGTPIPLFNLYRAEDGVTPAHLSYVTVGYLAAAASSLLMMGRLSNHLGRRPVALAAIAIAAMACLILIALRGPGPLFVARVLQGLASGLASSALGALVVDAARDRPAWMPAAITGSAPMVGIPLGAITCGALVQFAPAPKVLVYAVMLVALATCAALILASPETMPRSGGALRSLRPRLQAPAGSARLVVAACSASVATWCLGSFYQAFGSAVVVQYLGSTSPLVAALVFSSMMSLTPLGGPLAARLSPAASVRTGMALYLAALAGIVAALQAGAVLPFIFASLAVGLSTGISSTGGLRALLAKAGPHERAGLLATFYLVSYGGAAFPGIVAGRLTGTFDLKQIAFGYAAIGAIGACVAFLAAANPKKT
jgi:MFS family permease